MKRLIPIAFVVLTWALPDPGVCTVAAVQIWDSYINGPGSGTHADGTHTVDPSQVTITLASGKPVTDCAIAWRIVSIDALGNELPPECQPIGIAADGQSWEGM
jgi:hypothetical protein